jgi:MFS family permease
MWTIRTGAKAISRSLPALSQFLSTLAAMVVRISPVVVAVAASWLLLFYTEQGHDLLAGARSDVWQTCRLLVAVYLFSALAAFCTVYLLNLPPDWDSGRIVKPISVWARKPGIGKPKQDKESSKGESEKSKEGSNPDTEKAVRALLIFFAALWAGALLFHYVSLYLFGLSFGFGLLKVVLLFVGAVFVYIAAFILILRTPVRPFRITTLLFCVSALLIIAFLPVQTGLFLGSEFTFFLLLSLWLLLVCALVGHLSIRGLEAWQAITAVVYLAWIVGGISDWFRESAPPATPIRCIGHPCQPPGQALVKLDEAFAG